MLSADLQDVLAHRARISAHRAGTCDMCAHKTVPKTSYNHTRYIHVHTDSAIRDYAIIRVHTHRY